MNFKKTLFVALFPLLIFVLSECSSTAPFFYTPAEVNVSSKATLAELNQGRAYFMEKCGECHRMPAPSKLPADKWSPVLDDMQVKAARKSITITNEQKALIYKYLTSEK